MVKIKDISYEDLKYILDTAKKGARLLSKPLHEIINVSQSTVYRWNNGLSKPYINAFKKLTIISEFYFSYEQLIDLHEKEITIKKHATHMTIEKLNKRDTDDM